MKGIFNPVGLKKMTSKVLLIGWDAADWKIIHPLIDNGKMPNMAKFIEQGVIGNLATLYPELSPMLWTSIATGKSVERLPITPCSINFAIFGILPLSMRG